MSLVDFDVHSAAQPREGADLVLDAFLRHHVRHVFIFPGGTIAPILDRIEKRSKIEIVCPRTEQGAGYAALGYARMTGETAVFMVTSGPGVTNAVTPDRRRLLRQYPAGGDHRPGRHRRHARRSAGQAARFPGSGHG